MYTNIKDIQWQKILLVIKMEMIHNRIPGRGDVPRTTVVREVKLNKHPLHTTTRINGKEYVKAKPDNRTINNVNR